MEVIKIKDNADVYHLSKCKNDDYKVEFNERVIYKGSNKKVVFMAMNDTITMNEIEMM